MLQRPKNNPSGLNDANHKQLISELTKYAEEGASDKELQEFKKAFIDQKKKSTSISTSETAQLASPTQQKPTPILSDTEETQPPVESDGLGGPPKMKTFTGFTPEEQQTLQAKPVPKISKSPASKKLILQRELATTKVTPENQEEILRKTEELVNLNKEQEKLSDARLSEIEQQFKAAKDEDAADIEADKRLNDALTNTGIWNNVKSASIDMYNAVLDQPALRAIGADKLKADVDVLSDEKKEILKDAAKNKIELTDAEVEERAKQLYKNKQKDYIETDNLNSFLDNLDESDKNLLKQNRKNLAENLQEINIKEEKVINAYEVVGNKKINEYKAIEQELFKYKNNNQPLPKELYDSYVSLGNEIVGIGNSIQKRQSIIDNNREDLGNVRQEFDLLKRRYGDIDNAVTNIGLGGTKILNGILGFTNYAAKFAGGAQGQIYSLAGQQVTDKISDYIVDEESQLRKPVESIESPEGFINYVSDIISKHIPNLVATSTGIGGLGVIGVSSTGEKYTEMTREVLEGKATYSPLQMAVAPALWGSAEVISEIPTASILFKGKRLIDAIVKNEGDLIKKSVKEKAKEWAKDWSVDMGKEVTGEEFTNFAQNFTNKYILGKKDVGLLDNAGTVLKDTFTLTNILKAAPHVAGAVLKSHQNNSDLNILDENSKKIIDFSKQLENELLNDTEIAVINKQIDKATAQNSKIIANTIEKVNNMPDDVYKRIIDLNNNIADIKIEAVAINDGNLPNKAELIKSLESDYRTAQTERNALIDAKYESPLQKSFNKLENNEKIKLKDQASRILMEEAKSKGLKNFEFNDQAITDKAVELFKQTVSEVAPTEVVAPAEVVAEEPRIKDSQIPLKRETFEVEDENGDISSTIVTTKKDGSRGIVVKVNGNQVSSDTISKNNTLSTEEYITIGYGDIKGEAKIEQGNDIMTPGMKEKLTPKQKEELGITEVTPTTEVISPETITEVVEPAPSLAKEYIQSIEKSKSEAPEKFWSVDRPFQKEDGTIDEVQLDKAAEEGRIIKTESGFGVVGEDGDIKGVFKADLKSTEKTGDKVIQEAVKKGGIKLDNFALPNLMKIYERNGFREVSRLPFNEEYAPEGWTPEQGTPDVVAMVYDPNEELNIEKKSFTDYDEAMSYRDSYVKQKPTVKSKLEAFKAKYINKPVYDRTKLDTQVDNAKKSLSKLLPNVKFVVHDTKESFIGVSGKNARGYYDPATKTIHINSLEANARTVAHEVFHSVLLDKVKTDANARDLTKRMISAISKTLEGNPDLKKNLDDFVKNYDENIQNEEKLSELFGYLADGYTGFDAPTKSVIKRAMDRLAKMFGLKPFTEGEIVDMLKTLSGKVATGEEIVSKDIKAISEGASSYISEPTNIERFSKTNEENVVVGYHELSFVKESDLIDIDALMKDITAKKQNVWFWVADQLGRGNYFDKVIDGEHYLDAGPSFALDPKNRDRNVIWATGKEEKEITKLIGRSDYIFIISGSAQKSKLFNKKVFELFEKRIGNYASFKKEVLDSNPTKPMRDVLNAHNSWETLREDASVDNAKTKTIGTGRKKFLIALLDAMEKPKSKAYNTYQKRNAFVDVNDIRDGFYKDNNFNQNDIMLVLKPTKIGGKSEHSTYENDILGEVVGVPNIKVNAFDIMTPEVKDKYKKVLQITEQQQAVAPYGIGVKQIERFQESEDYSDMKEIVKDMIDEGMSVSDIKKTIGSELGADQVSLAERAYNELTEEVITKEPTGATEAFRDKVKDIPESGKVSKYLSGETIERVEGEAPRNIQEIDVMPLVEAGMHGKETVAMAKEVYGDKYIEKTLEFLDTANLKAHEKALLYVSLENEMFDLVNSEPNNVGLKKLQDLVRAKSQQFLRESSLAINMGRLRAIMKDGFNYESITDGFLSTDQLIGKKEVEKAIQSDANAIQKEYEGMVSESDLEQLILSGVEKQINEIYKKLPTARKVKADKAIAALERIQKKLKGKAYDATIGLPIALIDSGITIIKNSIKAGVNIADAIELGINHIKEKYGKDWTNEGMFRDDMTQGFKSEGVSEKEIKAKELSDKDIVNQALIEAGFGKEITVKKEKRKVLDWKKLAGEEGSVDKLRENVEKIIGKEAAKELENEYNNLRASIIEKSLNELERRNIPRKKVNLKTSAKKLAEIYNYGLFEKESDTYDKLMNTVLGMNELDQKSFNEAKKLAKSLSELFSQKDSEGNQLNQTYLKQAERVINKQIERLLSSVAWSESNGAYKAMTIAKEFVGLSQRNALVSVAQAVENTTSGYISRAFKKIGFMFDNVDTKALKESRNKLARMTFKDITLGGGLEFGDVTSPFITKSKTMDLIINASDSRLYHALTSTALGKPFLESADSMHKAALAQGFFHYNLIKILRKKGYSKTEAKNYVSEQLTGQSFEDALVTSKEIIDKINQNAGKKVIPDSKESIYRFANDLVNEALVKGNKITLDELEASLKSAETVAGFELGHEPNNIISKPLNLFNSWVQTRTDKAIKDKKWNDAAALTAASIVTTNILNPYVGGGTNWTLLAAQKAGIPTLSTIYWNIKARGSKLDLSTEEGMKNLEKDLKYQLLAKNANTRMFIGAAVTLAAFALAKSTGADDDLYEWLKKNPWANKYMKKTNPPAVQFMLAQKDKKLGEFLGQQMNIKVDAFDEGKKLQQAMKNAASGKTQKALGGAGQLAGSRLSTPIIPWRVVRDVRDIYRGLNGLPAIKHEYKASGFASGYFQGGMVEQLGLRPEDVKDVSGGRESSGSRSESGSRQSSGTRTQSGNR